MNKKVLLTGISGFVGQHCAVELLKSGYKVRGSIRSLAKQDEVLKGISKVIDPKKISMYYTKWSKMLRELQTNLCYFQINIPT